MATKPKSPPKTPPRPGDGAAGRAYDKLKDRKKYLDDKINRATRGK